MAFPRRTALLLLLLLVATEMGPMEVVEARDCLSQSFKFRGTCLSSGNCGNVCRTEGFPDGECKTQGLARKCFCKRPC